MNYDAQYRRSISPENMSGLRAIAPKTERVGDGWHLGGVGSRIKPLYRPKTRCEVGEVGVVQQIGKLRPEPRGRAQ